MRAVPFPFSGRKKPVPALSGRSTFLTVLVFLPLLLFPSNLFAQMSSTSPVGTLAYIIDEEALLVRVNKGWQYIAVSIPRVPRASLEFPQSFGQEQ